MHNAIREYSSGHPPSPEIEVDELEERSHRVIEEAVKEDGDEERVREECLQDELETVRSLVSEVLDEIRELKEMSSEIGEELERIHTEDGMLQDLHMAHKKLSEDFHERETLAPVFHTLIGIADRCYQQIALAKTEQASLGPTAEAGRLSSLIGSREADLIEIESRLADFGVQRYLSTKEDFNAKIHKCVQRRKTGDASRSGRISSRLLPGYRRNGKIVRPECVSVYVFATKPNNEGETSCQ